MTIDQLFSVQYVWIFLNLVLILYGLIMFFYGRFCSHKNKNPILFVIIIIYNFIIILFIQKKNDENKLIIEATDESIRITDAKNSNIIDDDKHIQLIDK